MVRKLKAFNYRSYCYHNSGLFKKDRAQPIYYYYKYVRICARRPLKLLTLIRLGFLVGKFFWGDQFDSPFILPQKFI